MERVASAFDLSPAEQELLERRESLLLPLANQYRPPRTATVDAAKKLDLGYAMVRRLIQHFRKTNDPLSLLGHRSGRPKGVRLLPQPVEQIIKLALAESYAKRQRPRIEAVYKNIHLACTQRGLPVPSLSTVRRRFAEADPEFIARRRHGPKAARKLTPVKGQARPSDYPLHVVQMDHTRADVIIVSSQNRKPIGRPWVTIAIDLYSRCIAGFYVSLEPPSATVVGLCLANVAMDKEVILGQYQVEGQWPLAGKPVVLHTDNGSDFISKALKLGCLANGIKLEHRPVARPWYGGTIERVIGTFMGAVHDELPGTTHSNIAARGEYDSEGNACLTLAEFEEWLVHRIIEYHNTTHSSLGEPPLQRLLAGLELEDYTPRPIQDLKTYLTDFLPMVRRHLQRNGFQLDNLSYYDPKLDYYIARRDNYRDGFELRRDPRNLRFIWMRTPGEREYIEIPYRDLTLPDMTLWEHRQAVKAVNEKNAGRANQKDVGREVLARREVIRKASSSTKRARRDEERLKHNSPLMGSQHSSDPAPPEQKSPEQLKPFELEVDWS